jgi:hypothetical protein
LAKITISQTENGEGLAKVVLFTGLSHSVLMHPIVHGEPALTAQAFYYLDELECVAKIRLESKNDEISDGEIEYLIDNYLFEFSKIYPEESINQKGERGKLWRDEPEGLYIEVDQRHTQSLAIDSLNDSSVHSIKTEDLDDFTDFSDWDSGRNYTKDCLQSYLSALALVLEKKVAVRISPSAGRDGYWGKLRVLKPDYGLIDYWQALALTDICIRDIKPATTQVELPISCCARTITSLPLERITGTKKYTPILLSHYFSGLKERNPLKAFVGFYNVLEYYFEDAPRILDRPASNEKKQLELVIRLITYRASIIEFIGGLGTTIQQNIFANIPTSSGPPIGALSLTGDVEADLARWLYEIRCAVIHSKRTRRGLPTQAFEPYSSQSLSLQTIIPVVRWLAVLCIEKDHAIRNSAHQ